MKALVTGCAGFIGSHLTQRLLATGWEVIGLDNFHPFYPPALKWEALTPCLAHPHFTLLQADLRDAAALDRALSTRPEVVVHLAALAGVRPSLEDPVAFMDVNVSGTMNLLERCHHHGVLHLVLASSSSVYGEGAPAPFREDLPLGRPLSPYAVSKAAGELQAQMAHTSWGMSIAILRFFTVYGPWQRPDLAIHKFTRLIATGQPIPFFGDGSNRRDYTHVSDIVRGVEAAVAWVLAGGSPRLDTFNLAGGQTIDLASLVGLLERELGVQAQLLRLPPHAGDMANTWADLTHTRAVLGLVPHVEFEEGIRDFVRWYRSQAPR